MRCIDLITVVLAGVVRSRDHDTSIALVVTGSKAQCRHRHQSIVNAHLDTVCRQNACGGLGKDIALQAAVVADRHSLAAPLSLDPGCQTLRGLTHNIDIHTVGASAQNAAQTSGAKLQSHSKAVLDLVIISLDLGQLRLQISVFQLCSHPALIFIQIHLAHLTFCKFFRKKKQV